MARLTLREASRLTSGQLSATERAAVMTPPNCGYPVPPRNCGVERKMLVRGNPGPRPGPGSADSRLARRLRTICRAQLTDTSEECDRLQQQAERLASPPPAPAPVPLRPRRRRRWWQPAW
jgi:hypothetical protein